MDLILQLLAELRDHADVYARYRVVHADGSVIKGVALTDALNAAAKHGGRVDRAELWSLPGGYEVLTPWAPINLSEETDMPHDIDRLAEAEVVA